MDTRSSNTKPIIGASRLVQEMNSLIDRVATSRTNVLVIGESGTGKELVARMIHEKSPLGGMPFVPVNCGAIPENLIESELFGHKKGSFTGAVSDKMGLFEAANNGTLFLDEIGELPIGMQVKLLRAIQDKTIRRVGGTDDRKIDVRIIAATNRDLETQVKEGKFREDLYYRLNVIQIKTPALRDREGDVDTLIGHFVKIFADKQKKKIPGVKPEVYEVLKMYHWPGNVRELENVIERAVTLSSEDDLAVDVLPQGVIDAARTRGSQVPKATTVTLSPKPVAMPPRAPTGPGGAGTESGFQLEVPDFSAGPINLDSILARVEKSYLLAALEHTGGIKKKAADCLGITFRSIRYRLKKIGLDDEE